MRKLATVRAIKTGTAPKRKKYTKTYLYIIEEGYWGYSIKKKNFNFRNTLIEKIEKNREKFILQVERITFLKNYNNNNGSPNKYLPAWIEILSKAS